MKHKRQYRRQQAGFSLIELLIVVAIIGILAAVAVPKLLENLRVGREVAAIETLRTMHTSQAQFSTNNHKFGTLKDLVEAKLIDAQFASGTAVNGYIYTSTEGTPDQYCIQATRQSTSTATKDFNIIEDGTIRFVQSNTPSPVAHGQGTPYGGTEGQTQSAPSPQAQ